MNELLKRAISAVEQLPEGDQNEIARMMLAMSKDDSIAHLPAEHEAAVCEGLAQAQARTLADDDAVAAAWRRFDP